MPNLRRLTKRNDAKLCLALAAIVALLGITAASEAETIFTVDTYIAGDDPSYDGDDIVVDGCTVTIDGAHSFASLTVVNAGIVTHTAEVAGFDLTVLGDTTIETGGAITAQGAGHPVRVGPGTPPAPGGYNDGGGAGYGGAGGQSKNTGLVGGSTYGSVAMPTALGSGGGGSRGTSTGGGALRLVVGGTLLADGTIDASGGDGSDGIGSGGGSGGSIWLDVGILAGSGTISADGADGTVSSGGAYYGGGGGGGGGGRIAIYYDIDSFTGTIRAAGGDGHEVGGPGTIYRKASSQAFGDLEVYRTHPSGPGTPLPVANYAFDVLDIHSNASVTLPSGATLTLTPAEIEFSNAGTLEVAGILTGGTAGFSTVTASNSGVLRLLSGGTVTFAAEPQGSRLARATSGGLLHVGAGSTFACDVVEAADGTFMVDQPTVLAELNVLEGGVVTCQSGGVATLDVTVLGDTTIETGGALTATGLGYPARVGPGTPPDPGGHEDGAGAGYGGGGGRSKWTGLAGGGTYGSVTTPIDLGSGGGGDRGTSAGGGALRLVVGGTLLADGTIDASGGDGSDGIGSGGGSGGSIWLDVGILAGSGTISADGADGTVSSGGAYYGGGGGGGRIAIYTACEPLISTRQVRAWGGSGYEDGEDGTIYWSILPDVLPQPCGTVLYVDPTAGDPNQDGSSWALAYSDLQSALDVAALGDPNDCVEVWVASNVYTPSVPTDPNDPRSATFKLLNGVQLYGGFEGLNSAIYPGGETLRNQRDPAVNLTILSGDLNGDDPATSENAYHVVTTSGWERAAVLDGFLVTAGVADGADDFGGGIVGTPSRVRLANTTVTGNAALNDGGGMRACCSTMYFDEFTIDLNSAAYGDVGVFRGLKAVLDGDLYIAPGNFVVESTFFTGGATTQGVLSLAEGTLMEIVGGDWQGRPTVFQVNVQGLGDIYIHPGQTLQIENGAVVDLSGGLGGGCADPAASANWGQIDVEGVLLVTGATIENTKVEVALGGMSDNTTVYNNDVTLLESAPGFGGEFFVEGDSMIQCNVITSYGDRYLDMDPDPNATPRPTIADNLINVIITQATASGQGELLELRSEDSDYDTIDAGMSGAYELSEAQSQADPNHGYHDAWVLERLELEPGGRVTLTNRPGFVFQDPNIGTPEALYVKRLKLHADSVLNTGLQRLYYQELVDENDQPLQRDPNTPGAPLANGSRIVDYPLLGFSLKVIELDDDPLTGGDDGETEFAVRVRQRTSDPNDPIPAEPPYPGGAITRESAPDKSGEDGYLRMSTEAPSYRASRSVAAHGAFARAGDERVLVEFDYRFCAPSDPNTVLIVYLSDAPEPRDATDPDWPDHFIEVARVYPPPLGRPGSLGDPRFATFSGVFDRQQLNFTRGTYVELELRGGVDGDGYGLPACVEIDRWDPQIRCTLTCLDLSGDDAVTAHDFLLHMAEVGGSVDSGRGCLDAPFATNGYVDLDDVLALDALLSADPPPTHFCAPPVAGDDLGTPVAAHALPQAGLLVAGKPQGGGRALQQDWLYAFDCAGESSGARLPPASASPYHGNGRLYKAPNGTVYQLHATQGLIRLDTAEREIAPFSQDLAGQTVYVGVQPTSDLYDYELGGYPQALPLLDVAIDRNDPNFVYVVPVVVESTANCPLYEGPCPYYRAAAQLQRQPNGDYEVTQVYGVEPAVDPCRNTDPPSASACQVQGQCEIEVDGAGRVLVLSASGHSTANDWLVVYDAEIGAELERIVLTEVDAGLANPSTLLTSRQTADRLYLTSERDADPNDGQLKLYRCDLDLGSPGSPLTVTQAIAIDCSGVLPPEHGYGHLLLATDLLENPNDGTVHLLGTALARFSPSFEPEDLDYELYFCDTCPLLAAPLHAEIPAGSAGPLTATPLNGSDLALPLAGLLYVSGDISGDDLVNGDDVAAFTNCMAGPGASSPCGPDFVKRIDRDQDNDLDLMDLANWQ